MLFFRDEKTYYVCIALCAKWKGNHTTRIYKSHLHEFSGIDFKARERLKGKNRLLTHLELKTIRHSWRSM